MLAGDWRPVGIHPAGQGRIREDGRSGTYLTSCAIEQHTGAEMMDIIRGQWSAIENGTHYRRDVSLGEDACRGRILTPPPKVVGPSGEPL